jgi:hypothetical protein
MFLKIWNTFARCAGRLFIGLGFLTRTVVLLLFILVTVNVLPVSQIPSLRGTIFFVLHLPILVLLIFWLFRTGTKPYRMWGVLGLAFGLCMATAPCWYEFPAQDFGSESAQERAVVRQLKRIQAAESGYYAQFHRYGDFLEISVEGIPSFSESQALLSPFRVNLIASANSYRLTAEPSFPQHGYGCCIGCPRSRYFYVDESGILRANRYCRLADARSPKVD